jgi:hypothetical protein
MSDVIYDIKTGNEDGLDFLANDMGSIVAIVLVELLVSFVTFIAGEGAMIRATADTYAAQPPGWYQCLKMGLNKFCTVLLAGLTVFGISMGGVLCYEIVLVIFAAITTDAAWPLLIVVFIVA